MSVYDTYGVARGSAAGLGNDLAILIGTLDLAALQTQAPLLAAQSGSLTSTSGTLTTDSTAYTALAGSIVSAITLGHTVSAGDVTLVGSLTASSAAVAADGTEVAAEAAAIATESAAITAAVGTVTADIFLAVNIGSSANLMDVRLAVETIEMYLLSGAPLGRTTNFPPD